MYIEVAAHRGNVAEYPENTMLAFKKALEIGVDQIETDVRITSDGELVCIHDDCGLVVLRRKVHRVPLPQSGR